jgi:hypothetical protein
LARCSRAPPASKRSRASPAVPYDPDAPGSPTIQSDRGSYSCRCAIRVARSSDVHPCPLLSVTYAMVVAAGSSYDLDADAKQRVVPRSEAPLCCSRIRHRTRGSDRAAGKLDRQPCPRHRAPRRQDTRCLDPARLPSHGAGRQLRGGRVHEIREGFRFGADSRAHSSGRSVARKHHAR